MFPISLSYIIRGRRVSVDESVMRTPYLQPGFSSIASILWAAFPSPKGFPISLPLSPRS